ncbi:MAG TPA: PIG-L family deacetylase [Kiritimatiellia bacterium]|nr:PIG-L family deacetylase [Kiritimatiellia bacterium]HPS07388.1 PIG-L family deacetylase [Kiritimatiellia bacterium]
MEPVRPCDLRIMIIGAHPDDPDITGGGIALKYVKAGATVKLVSMCNGDKGHMTMSPEALAARRYLEAQRSKAVLGVDEYRVVAHHDCELEVTLEMRKEMTRLIREFAPHVVFTHRTCDYHADHRAVGTLVMDSAYLLGVPLWCPEMPVSAVKPAIYFLRDAFTHPAALRPDIVVDIDGEMDQLLTALCAHESQFFEWLVFDKRIAEPVPATLEGRKAFIEKYWMVPRKKYDAERFRSRLVEVYGQSQAARISHIEAYELSEYGYQPSAKEVDQLFPFLSKASL